MSTPDEERPKKQHSQWTSARDLVMKIIPKLWLGIRRMRSGPEYRLLPEQTAASQPPGVLSCLAEPAGTPSLSRPHEQLRPVRGKYYISTAFSAHLPHLSCSNSISPYIMANYGWSQYTFELIDLELSQEQHVKAPEWQPSAQWRGVSLEMQESGDWKNLS